MPRQADCTSTTLRCLLQFFKRTRKYVMAVHPAAKAIDTQDITEKARRDLLQLLETVRLTNLPSGDDLLINPG